MSKIILPRYIQSPRGSISLQRLIQQTIELLGLVVSEDEQDSVVDKAIVCEEAWKEIVNRADFRDPYVITIKGE